ncbi:MAG TPA: MBL fold metallo-hydrolase, partial [Nitrospira sp.]|nr:MBL fold metallo-hydrolase [Nitrospira sp.]
FIALRGGGTLTVHGDTETMNDLRRTFTYAFESPAELGGGVPRLVASVEDGPFVIGDTEWIPVPIFHGRRLINGYRIGGFAYLTDCSGIPETSWPLLDGLDVLVVGALRETPHPTHFSLDEAIAAARRTGARRTLFTHMCHDLGHAETNAHLPEGMSLAYDGLSVTLPGTSP